MPPWIYCSRCDKKYYPWTTCQHLPPREEESINMKRIRQLTEELEEKGELKKKISE